MNKAQSALEIYGRLLNELYPSLRATGDTIEHAESIAAQVRELRKKEEGKKKELIEAAERLWRSHRSADCLPECVQVSSNPMDHAPACREEIEALTGLRMVLDDHDETTWDLAVMSNPRMRFIRWLAAEDRSFDREFGDKFFVGYSNRPVEEFDSLPKHIACCFDFHEYPRGHRGWGPSGPPTGITNLRPLAPGSWEPHQACTGIALAGGDYLIRMYLPLKSPMTQREVSNYGCVRIEF